MPHPLSLVCSHYTHALQSTFCSQRVEIAPHVHSHSFLHCSHSFVHPFCYHACHLAMLPAFAWPGPTPAPYHKLRLAIIAVILSVQRLHVPADARHHLHAASDSKAQVVLYSTDESIPAPTKSKHNIHVVCCCITSKPTRKPKTPS